MHSHTFEPAFGYHVRHRRRHKVLAQRRSAFEISKVPLTSSSSGLFGTKALMVS